MKSKYSTTLCLLCGAYIAKGVAIGNVGGTWVYKRCLRHDYTNFSAPAQRAVSAQVGNMPEVTAAQQKALQYASKAQFWNRA